MFDAPLRFVHYSFAWGKADLAEYDGPDQWQTETLRDIGAALAAGSDLAGALRMAIASGHGIGKSALVAWLILWAMSTRPHLAGVVTANTANQLETKTWRELSVWHKRAINAHWFTWTATKFYQNDHPETWCVNAIPWREEKSEAFAGLHAEHVLVIYDEASAVADIIWEVSEGATTTRGAMWFAFGNPTRNTGRFRECWGRFKHRWITRQIDSRTAKMANQAQIRQWIDDYGEDSDFVRVRVKGEFPRSGSSQFISSEIVTNARLREFANDDKAGIVIGVDVARFGDDQSVIRHRVGRDARSIKPRKFRGIDTMQLTAYVVEEIQRYGPIAVFVDGGGVGGAVVDRLKQLGYKVVEVQFGAKASEDRKYANKRGECWGRMRDWLAAGGMIADDPELAADLEAPEYGYDNQNRVQLEKKDDMKKRGLASPDDGDALALTFAENVQREDVRDLSRLRRQNAPQSRQPYDPFALRTR